MKKTEDRSQKSEVRSLPRHAWSGLRTALGSQISALGGKRFRSEQGIALVLTLAILTLVTLLVIAFAVSMRVENTASKNFNDLIKARQLAQAAVDEAVATIRDATPVPSATLTWTAAPGVIHQVRRPGIFTTKPLYTTGPNTYNINTAYFITGFNSLYNTPANSAINVSWKNITVGSELVGRVAYWVDNEMAKVNVNYAKLRDPGAINESNPTNIDVRALEPPFYRAGTLTVNAFWTSHSTPPDSPWFSTLEEMRRGFSPAMTLEGFASNKFFTTVSTVDTNTDVFGRPRVDINSITEADILNSSSPIRTMFSDDTWATTLYPNIVTDASRNTIQKKYGDYGVEQILANLIEYKRPIGNINTDVATGANNRNAEGIPLRYCGLKKFPLLGEIMVQAASTNIVTSAAPGVTNYNVQVSVYCDARLINPYDTARGQGGRVKFVADSITVDATPASLNPLFNFTLTELARPITTNLAPQSQKNLNSEWQPGGTVSQRISDSPTNSMWRVIVPYSATNAPPPTINKVTVNMRKVRLLRGTSDDTIQDWATKQDFDAAYPSGMEFSPTSPDGGKVVPDIPDVAGRLESPRFSTVGTSDPRGARLGIAKNDPRVRTFPGQSAASAALDLEPPRAWFKPMASSICFGACASRPTGSSAAEVLGWIPTLTEPVNFTQPYYRLLADNRDIISPNGGTPIQEAQSTFYIREAPFVSLGELSYIHTGYQWRNVRLRASVAYTGSAPTGPVESDPNRPTYLTVEQAALQDWVLLDMLSIGQGIVPGRINLNSNFTGPASALAVRHIPYIALLNASTTNLSVQVPGLSNEVQLVRIASNIVSRVPATGSTYFNILPAYFTPGEYCEVFDMDYYNDPRGGSPYDAWPGKTEREQMIRRISNLVTARSNLFTIWGVAQAIKEPNVAGQTLGMFQPAIDIITGEVKVQAIVERYEEGTPPVVKFRTRYYRFIYD